MEAWPESGATPGVGRQGCRLPASTCSKGDAEGGGVLVGAARGIDHGDRCLLLGGLTSRRLVGKDGGPRGPEGGAWTLATSTASAHGLFVRPPSGAGAVSGPAGRGPVARTEGAEGSTSWHRAATDPAAEASRGFHRAIRVASSGSGRVLTIAAETATPVPEPPR